MSRNGRVEVEGGEIAFERSGAGPPVLLVQGVGVAGCAWSPQVEPLQDRHEFVSFDHRGIGSSSGVSKSIAQMAEDGFAVMDALGWSSAHLCGHSMGGVILQEMALRAPERVRSLSFLCTVSRGRRVLRWSPSAQWRQFQCQVGTRQMRRRAFFRLVSPKSLWRCDEARVRELERVFGRGLADQPAAVFRQVFALVRYDATRRLDRLRAIPRLVLSGDEDAVCTPSEGTKLAALLDVDCQILSGGHAVVVHNAEAVNAALAQLWKDAEAAHHESQWGSDP